MSSWDNILKEVQNTKTPQDFVRRKYLRELSKYTNRNVITYYSGWMSKRDVSNIDLNDNDMNGFMLCVKGLDSDKGLDLILHTPGGSPTAAESIVNYLRDKFNNDIRVIVPQMAMSAGTMMACAAKEIIMGKHSSLGPIDPQFNGIPAYNIKREFEKAKNDLQINPQNINYWQLKLQRYPCAFLESAIDAIGLASNLVGCWLGSCMYDAENDSGIIDNIVSKLNEHDESKVHGRHFNSKFCQDIGLKVTMLEDDSKLQDKVLSLHHAYMITFDTTIAVKLIENQNGKALINVDNRISR